MIQRGAPRRQRIKNPENRLPPLPRRSGKAWRLAQATLKAQAPDSTILPPTRAPTPLMGTDRTVLKRKNRGGRPKGARNKVTRRLKALLEPADEQGVYRLLKIIQVGKPEHAIEAIRLAWEYRYGKPKRQIDENSASFDFLAFLQRAHEIARERDAEAISIRKRQVRALELNSPMGS